MGGGGGGSKVREAFVICKGKTVEPYGMNRRDETLSISLFLSWLIHTFLLSMFINQTYLISLFISIILNIVTVYFQFLLSFLQPPKKVTFV